MHDDLATPPDGPPVEQYTVEAPDLVAVPDDPEDPAEVTVHPEDAGEGEIATAWITVGVDDLVELQAMR